MQIPVVRNVLEANEKMAVHVRRLLSEKGILALNLISSPGAGKTTGVRRRLLWDQIRGLADHGCGVLLVTHNVSEAERVVDHLAVLDRGAVVASGTPASLTARLSGTLTLEADLAPHARVPWPGAARNVTVEHLRATATVEAERAADMVRWAQGEVTDGRLERYALKPASLEDVYVALVGEPHASEAMAAVAA